MAFKSIYVYKPCKDDTCDSNFGIQFKPIGPGCAATTATETLTLNRRPYYKILWPHFRLRVVSFHPRKQKKDLHLTVEGVLVQGDGIFLVLNSSSRRGFLDIFSPCINFIHILTLCTTYSYYYEYEHIVIGVGWLIS